MANLVINDVTVTVAMSAAEKAEALHADLSFPRIAVTAARSAPDGLAEVHGIRLPGTHFPGLIMVGTWRSEDGITFAVCHGHRPAIVIDLAGQHYDRVVMTMENPEDAVTRLS
jgi:hypothetical protein